MTTSAMPPLGTSPATVLNLHSASAASIFAHMRSAILHSTLLQNVARLYSCILGQKVTPSRAIHLTSAQLAMAALILFGGASLLLAAPLLAWFAAAVYLAREK